MADTDSSDTPAEPIRRDSISPDLDDDVFVNKTESMTQQGIGKLPLQITPIWHTSVDRDIANQHLFSYAAQMLNHSKKDWWAFFGGKPA